MTKGRVVAWYLYKNIREGYESEKQEAHAKTKGKGGDATSLAANPAFRYGRDLLAARAAKLGREP